MGGVETLETFVPEEMPTANATITPKKVSEEK